MIKFTGLSPKSWEWIHEKLQPDLTARTKGIVAFDDETSEILAVTVWDSWTYSSGIGHFAIGDSKVIGAGYLHECFHYFFNTAEMEIMLTTVRSSNEDCLKFLRAVGFLEAYRVKDGFMIGEDIIVHEMRKSDCRYIEDGKAKYSKTA